jgi:PIN domain nuclease of toxin-antitoxin system
LKFLLDTHVFLWWVTDDRRLSSAARQVIANREEELFLSAASAWEMALKSRLGRLKLPGKVEAFLIEQMSINDIRALPIQIRHALHTRDLPNHHQDPFDRMIVSQAQLEGLTVLTADPLIGRYKVDVLW